MRLVVAPLGGAGSGTGKSTGVSDGDGDGSGDSGGDGSDGGDDNRGLAARDSKVDLFACAGMFSWPPAVLAG